MLHLGEENQPVSNSHQTNRWIMTRINRRLSPDPGSGEGATDSRLPSSSSQWPASVHAARNSPPALPFSALSCSVSPARAGGLERGSQSLQEIGGTGSIQHRLGSGADQGDQQKHLPTDIIPKPPALSLLPWGVEPPLGNAPQRGCLQALAALSVGKNALLLPQPPIQPFRTQLKWPITENVVLPSFPDLYRLVRQREVMQPSGYQPRVTRFPAGQYAMSADICEH